MSFSQHNKKYQLVFKFISISLPLAFFILLELLLRLFHFGYDTSLFIEDSKKPGFVYNNAYVSNRFFTNLKDAPNSYTQTFKKKKSQDTYRIFVLGESSALGFPYTHRGSFPRMLEYRLDKTFSDKKFEIINLSITAVNSYTLMAFADEIIKMEPDAILIYAGHNEYYGAMGVGSTNRIGYNRSIIKFILCLKQFRVVQLAFSLEGKLKGTNTLKDQKTDTGLMRKVAGEQRIDFGSVLYNRGLNQFESNMDEMLHKYQKHNIPVFLSDIVSNEKGQKPFISVLSPSTDTLTFMNQYRKGLVAYKVKDFDTALNHFLAANQIDSTYAMNNFLIGEILYEKDDFYKAQHYYSMAKEFDVLRFRAPEEINAIIEKLCIKYNNIHFVESKKKFIANSPNGIIGNELFIDHLHPNIPGYFLISDAFYDALQRAKIFGEVSQTISVDSIKKEMPVTTVDSVYGGLVILFMKEEWPFYEPASYNKNKPKSYPEKLAVMIFLKQLNWEQAMDSLYRFYLGSGKVSEAIKVAKEVDYEHPDEWEISSEIGKLYLDIRNYDEALYYYKKAFYHNNRVDLARKIVLLLLQSDNLDETKQYLAYIRQNDQSDMMSIQLLRDIDKIASLKKELLESPQNIEITNALANYYFHFGNVEATRKYIEKSLAINAKNNVSAKLLKELNKLINTDNLKTVN
jgi:tetratricopeptide (TPR) repeat protein